MFPKYIWQVKIEDTFKIETLEYLCLTEEEALVQEYLGMKLFLKVNHYLEDHEIPTTHDEMIDFAGDFGIYSENDKELIITKDQQLKTITQEQYNTILSDNEGE